MAEYGVKTRFLIVSDTHTRTPTPADRADPTLSPFRDPLPEADVLLHAGDLTSGGSQKEHGITLGSLRACRAELKIIIAGNHDITLDRAFWEELGKKGISADENLDEIEKMYRDAEKDRIFYMTEGVRTFTLSNGAKFTIYTSPYQPAFGMWAFMYQRDEDRFNPGSPHAKIPIPENVDIVMTHGPPQTVLDKVTGGGGKEEEVGCVNLYRAVERVKPKIHCFGHIHEGFGAERINWISEEQERTKVDIPVGQRDQRFRDHCVKLDISAAGHSPLRPGDETLFVNASILNRTYKPVNPPWLIDIDLPRAEDTNIPTADTVP